MIVLDTNVISETLKHEPDRAVLAWLDSLTDDVALTSITVGELFTGIRQMPEGRRRDALLAAVETDFDKFDHDVLLPFDDAAARTYARLHEACRLNGRALSTEDGMIASTALVNGAVLATRNTKDFEGFGLRLIDPWQASARTA